MIIKEALLACIIVGTASGMFFGFGQWVTDKDKDKGCSYHTIVDYNPFKIMFCELNKDRW